MKTLILGLALAALAGTAPAHAENFNGPFVGAELGWNHDKAGRASLKGNQLDVDTSKDAAAAGLYAGYDLRLDQRFVFGAEVGVDAGIKDQMRRVETGATTVIDPRYNIDLTGRVGVLLDAATLLYGRGGYSTTRVSISQAGKDGVIRDRMNLDGWTAGGGVERVLASGLSARAEYRYADLKKDGASFKRQQVMFGLGYHF